MKTHKMKMTRPEFLMKFITTDGVELRDIEEISEILPVSSNLIYAAYTVLLESDLESKDIPYVNTDGDTIVLKFTNKKKPKEIKSDFNKMVLRFGLDYYKVHLKDKDNYLFVSLEFDHTDKMTSDDDDEQSE